MYSIMETRLDRKNWTKEPTNQRNMLILVKDVDYRGASTPKKQAIVINFFCSLLETFRTSFVLMINLTFMFNCVNESINNKWITVTETNVLSIKNVSVPRYVDTLQDFGYNLCNVYFNAPLIANFHKFLFSAFQHLMGILLPVTSTWNEEKVRSQETVK